MKIKYDKYRFGQTQSLKRCGHNSPLYNFQGIYRRRRTEAASPCGCWKLGRGGDTVAGTTGRERTRAPPVD